MRDNGDFHTIFLLLILEQKNIFFWLIIFFVFFNKELKKSTEKEKIRTKNPNKETLLGSKDGDISSKKKVAFDPIVKTFEGSAKKLEIKKTKEQLEQENEEKRKLMEEAGRALPFTFKSMLLF